MGLWCLPNAGFFLQRAWGVQYGILADLNPFSKIAVVTANVEVDGQRRATERSGGGGAALCVRARKENGSGACSFHAGRRQWAKKTPQGSLATVSLFRQNAREKSNN